MDAVALPAKRPATIADLLAIPAEERFHELLDGEIVRRATPSIGHGTTQTRVTSNLDRPFQRPPGPGGPGGWWIATEVEVQLPAGDVVRPDAMGWRREIHPERPQGTPITALPKWVCEIVSPERARDDTVTKLRKYQAARVPHYWILDPRDESLTVHRWTDAGYLLALRAVRPERVRAEPFDAIEIAIGELFGDDPD
jgi:Uma2 family endonuclease